MATHTNTRNPAPVKADPYRILAALLMFLSALLMAWLLGIGWAHLNQPRAAEYQNLAILKGDAKHRILMPPKHMQRDIIARMQAGKLKFKPMSMSQLKRDCDGSHAEYKLLACSGNITATLMGGVNVRVWDQLKGRDLQLVLIHEYAHALYGWQH